MFRVLSAHGPDAVEWDRFVSYLQYDLRDVHVTSGWGRSQERDGATAHLAVLLGNSVIAQPFLKRPITTRSGLMTGLFDLTANGYGGPVSNIGLLAQGDGEAFDLHFAEWRIRHSVISEFYMLNPVTFAAQLPLIERRDPLVLERHVTILPLGMDWQMRPNRVSSLKHSDRDRISHGWDASLFSDKYQASMIAKGASGRWRFTTGDFADLKSNLGERVQMIRGGDQVALHAHSIFLMGTGATAYYYLSCRDEKGHADRLITEAALMARYAGQAYLHLGGGLKDDDSLDKFKRSFGGQRRPVYSVRRIYDDATYAGLSSPLARSTTFFPAYRSREIE